MYLSPGSPPNYSTSISLSQNNKDIQDVTTWFFLYKQLEIWVVWLGGENQKKLMSLTLLLFQNSYFYSKEQNKKFQALQVPYLRFIDVNLRSFCFRWCGTSLCQGTRKNKINKEVFFALRNISLENTRNHLLASWAFKGKMIVVHNNLEDFRPQNVAGTCDVRENMIIYIIISFQSTQCRCHICCSLF